MTAWHWDATRGRRVRTRGLARQWAGRRDPFLSGSFVGALGAGVLVLLGAPGFRIVFGALLAGGVAAGILSLLAEDLTAADLTAPNPAELTPLDAARLDPADAIEDAAADAVDSVTAGIGEIAT